MDRSSALKRKREAQLLPMMAAICTVGPSRPNARPVDIASSPPTNLAGSTRSGAGAASPRITASTCWIPLPAALGAMRTTNRASAVVRPTSATAITPPEMGQSTLCVRSQLTPSIACANEACSSQVNVPPTTPTMAPAMAATKVTLVRPQTSVSCAVPECFTSELGIRLNPASLSTRFEQRATDSWFRCAQKACQPR